MEVNIQIKSIFGKVLFEFSKENNTIKDTLIEAVKQGANLDGANLDGANLRNANLRNASLDGANLDGANLYGANLYGANLYGANLYGARLDGANLDGANLDGANLYGANLYGASLDGANLYGANLYGANLYGARLDGANLYGASLDGAGKLSSVNDILIVGPLGSRSAYTQIYRTDKGIFVKCGCFFGTIDDFATKVKEIHGDNEHSKAYTRLIAYAKEHFEVKHTNSIL